MSIINDQLEIKYVPDFYSGSVADEYYRELLENIPFESLTFKFNDKTFTPSRKIAAFGDDGLAYSFSGITVSAKPWMPLIEKIKADVEEHMGVVYNFCFLNWYPDGGARISPHHDNESSMDAQVPIACVSLGATRQMIFTRSKDYSAPILNLENGSLMCMYSPTNLYWKHAIPVQPGVTTGRISLTFRALSSANSKRRFAAAESTPPAKCKRFTPVQEDPSNTLLLEKQIGIGGLLKVYQTRLGLYVGLYPINTCTPQEYECAVFMNPTTWMEFSDKMSSFNLRYQDSAFLCSDQVLVCVKHYDTCLIQQLYSTTCGYRLKTICMELDRDELTEFKDMLSEITNFLLDNMFSVSLPKLIQDCNVKPNVNSPLSSTNENTFWECILQAVSDAIHKQFKCEGCKIDDPSQWNHDCMILTQHEKFSFTGKSALLGVNISKLSRAICESVHVEQLDETVLKSLTLEKCVNCLNTDV